ncbi:MAG: thiamine pyrophosphate-binding protein [Actinomycetota bacterium]|nr:thiamine pyrophosphate-binding protein [Actinomycetota bacterium]
MAQLARSAPPSGSSGPSAQPGALWTAIVAVLTDAGVEVIFGLPDDDQRVLRAVTAAGIRFVICRDQRNAVFAATGYAMTADRLGVAVVGRGPAVTNTLTGLLEARSSAVPLLLFAGGTPARSLGSGAFQELDQVSVVRSLVTHAERVEHPERVVAALRRALLIASNGRPGPVYLEIPDHLFDAAVSEGHAGLELDNAAGEPMTTAAPRAWEMVNAAARPLILVGGGMRHRNRDRAVEHLAERLDAALTCTASGRGVLDEDHPQFLGLSGLYAAEASRPLWATTDCVVALGSRLEETATFGWSPAIGAEVPVIQVNIDVADIATTFGGCCVPGDAGAVVRSWNAAAATLRTSTAVDRTAWRATVCEARDNILATPRVRAGNTTAHGRIDVRAVLRVLQEEIPPSRVLVQENGLQDMWSYFFPAYSCGRAGGSIVPSEQTSLGFGAAAAIGVQVAAANRPVVALIGDGAFGMLGHDLVTAAEEAPGLLYVVLDNGGYGWCQNNVDQYPDIAHRFHFAADRRIGTLTGGAANVHIVRVESEDGLLAGIRQAWQQCRRQRTSVLVVPVDRADGPLAGTPIAGAFPAVDQAGTS